MTTRDLTPDLVVDASKTLCPTPVLRAKSGMDKLQKGQVMKLVATDPGSKADIPSFARMGGHELLSTEQAGQTFVYWLRKGGK
ncbi:MAG: sulfurtransferase TusA family protein [Dehalococcoidia bacterium]|nr:sulfurtransferase TusA family protein [Dehalococcoidia bacterium]